MLGTDACTVLGKYYEVVGRDIDDFDICDVRETVEAVRGVSPDVVLHLAAFTDVEASEDERERAFRCNALGTMNVAKAVRETAANLVYLSTDYVFDGTKHEPYVELDAPRPVNFYGLTKLYGEYYVRTLTLKHLVIRTSWLFGPNGRNFLDTIVAKAKAGERLRVVNDQRGCPTYTIHLAEALIQIIDRGLEGTIHIANSGDATWFEVAEHAIGVAGIDASVEPITTGSYPAKAARPAFSVLASDVMKSAGLSPLPHWRQGVEEHLARTGLVKAKGTT
jgi:dTDP-4-dehydrorhamnose reductase